MWVWLEFFGLSAECATKLNVTLADVGAVMSKAKDPWWIIGSAALAVHLKHDIIVNDIDVLLSVDDARLVRAALGIPSAAISPHPLFHSEEYFTWDRNRVPVEFMAGFSVCVAGAWQLVSCRTRLAVGVGGQAIYVPDLTELASLLELFGRPKDRERLALIKERSFSV